VAFTIAECSWKRPPAFMTNARHIAFSISIKITCDYFDAA